MRPEKEKVQQSMTAYLNGKYGMEFEVNSPYITGSMRTSHYQAKAYPKGHPEFEFLVDGDVYSERMNGKYNDYYLKAKWSYQGKQEVEKKLREVYGESVDFNISMYLLIGSFALKDLNYAEVFKKNHGNGRAELHYDVFMDGAQFNKEVEAEKAYKILKSFILDYGSDVDNFSVTYIDKNFRQDYLDQESHGKHIGVNTLYQQGKLINFLRAKYSSVVNSDSELVQFFNY